ncbi:pre-RNA processing PIH1/Nop17-domain-containing protein [Ochromonadaceae sp. CCMP2298]|nr:pre-RNA processing PIH1/Nop17-domain-containing protein [Ochromonadaceae sp. CCMP2298]
MADVEGMADAPHTAELEQLLLGLQQLQNTDPAAFQKAIQSLGLSAGPDGAPNPLADEGNLAKMADVIKQMRGAGDTGAGAVNMSKDKPKQPQGITIFPTAGFALKTSRLSDGMKVFLNIAQHETVDEPAIKKKLDDKGEEVEGMNIPMSVGAPRQEVDKKGVVCIVYDIIVNPVVILESTADKTGKYRDFICQLGMQYLEQKYAEELDKRYKLPKLKYMGDEVASQYIQDRKKMPKIEEVSSQSSKAGKSEADRQRAAAAKMAVEVVDRDLVYSVAWLVSNGAPNSFAEASHVRLLPGSSEVDMDQYVLREYAHPVVEYVDPIHQTEISTAAIVLSAEVPSYELGIDMRISLSPYRMCLKLPGYKKTTLHLACAVNPAASYYTLRRPYEGCLSVVALQLVLLVDHRDWAATADAGSKMWLMTQALSTEDTADPGHNPYADYDAGNQPTARVMHGLQETHGFAEDKFHLSLPDSVDHYTGQALDGATKEKIEEMELPEDRFHSKDAASTHLINQREQARKDKWDKHDKEKADRKDDPNVEYVDMEDFREGGKYEPQESKDARAKRQQTTEGMAETVRSEELRKAARVVAAAAGPGLGGAAGVGEGTGLGALGEMGLQSTLWTELLD